MTPANRIGAFFDIDGTLLPAPSLEWRFVSWLLARDLVSSWHIAGWAAAALPAIVCRDFAALRANKRYLAGLPESLAQTWEASLAPCALAAFSEGAAHVAWHLEQNHRVFLVSGTLAPLARAMARRFGASVESSATNPEVVCGTWTGLIEGVHVSGREKARIVAEIAALHELSLAESFAYGNHFDDLAMLESVGNPVAVNPGLRLKRIALRRGWQVERWRGLQSTEAAASQSLFAPREAH